MFTDKGMDSGDIIKKKTITIEEDDTYDIVSKKMSLLGASLLKEVLPSIFDKTCKREKQEEEEKTIARIIKREDEHLSFNSPAREVHNKIRGLSSVPGAYAVLDNSQVKILMSSLEGCNSVKDKPGTITRIDKNSIFVACLDKEIKLLKIQISGKKQMMVRDYLNGKDGSLLKGKIFE